MSSSKATYSYVAADVTPVATATDVITLTGVTGKVVRVTKVTVSGVATAASIYDVYLVKRSTLNTGGAATNPTETRMDSLDPPASAILTKYTGNPTLGTSAGTIDGEKGFLPAAATPVSPISFTEWVFGVEQAKEPVIRAGETFAINFGGAAVPAGASLYISIEWTEE